MKSSIDEFGRRVCVICGKTSDEVKFTATKNVCNICRSKKVVEYENSPERLVQVWGDRNKKKTKIFLAGKVDPCLSCLYTKCECCVVFHAKRNFLHPKSAEAKEFVTDFCKNLLENIRRVVV